VAIVIKRLEANDIPVIMAKPSFLNFHASTEYFQTLLNRQEKGEIVFLVAGFKEEVAGFLYVQWKSEYPPFIQDGIPDIKDLRILPEYRRKHIATVLLDEAEKLVFKRFPAVGLGVGLYADYGPAQRLYTRRGYTLDGRGLMYKEQPVPPGINAFVDDDLLLYLVKPSPPRHNLPNQ
jgi:ribosomal protein S18 acetylase RimI-like enzyme